MREGLCVYWKVDGRDRDPEELVGGRRVVSVQQCEQPCSELSSPKTGQQGWQEGGTGVSSLQPHKRMPAACDANPS